MGDRCYFAVRVRTADAQSEAGQKILADYFGSLVPDNESDMTREYVDDQMNWGGSEFLDEWTKALFMCEGFQEGGSEYPPTVFCFDGTREVEHEAWSEVSVCRDGGYVIDFDEEGEADPFQVRAVQDFIRLRKEVQKEMAKGLLEQLAGCAEHTNNKDKT